VEPVLWISGGWFVVVAWLIVRAGRQRGLLRTVPVASLPRKVEPRVVAIVPVRDEEANIGPCLQRLLAQDYRAECLNVLVIDDESADGTADIAARVAQDHPQVTLIRCPPLPPHWIGKSHACWIGARAAPADAEWLCFLDADVRAEPGLIAAAVATATSEHIDLLSLAPRQELKSFSERLIMPCGLCLLAFCQDLRKVQARRGDAVTATGQFMLVRREIYDAVGGHAAICGAICEDLELARRVKRAGGHVLLFEGRPLVSTRMYTGWKTLWPGFAKNLVDMLGGPFSTLTIAAAAASLAWAAVLVPVAAALNCADGTGCLALAPAFMGSGAAFGLHIAAAAYFEIPWWYGLLFPLGYTAGALIAIDSVRRRWRAAVSWKGRTYP
jgi:chlorobactene glucosyltransferase